MFDQLLSLFRLSRPTAVKGLALYNLTFCPFCIKVQLAIRRLGIKIELRNIDSPRWGDELVREGGKFQAPCLRIEGPDGDVSWLYESHDITLYLQQRFPPKQS